MVASGAAEESWHALALAIKVHRSVLAHSRLTGLFRHHLVALVEELAHHWERTMENRQHRARGGPGGGSQVRAPGTAWSSSTA